MDDIYIKKHISGSQDSSLTKMAGKIFILMFQFLLYTRIGNYFDFLFL